MNNKQHAELDSLLDARGIFAATRAFFGIKPFSLWLRDNQKDNPAWQYSTRNAANELRYRYKLPHYAEEKTRKYSWQLLPEGVEDTWELYLPRGEQALIDALSTSKQPHTLLWVAGEVDFWTLHAASGRYPCALSAFGEKNIPHDLGVTLERLGVETLLVYPDCDEAGLLAAKTLAKTLELYGVEMLFYQLPFEHGTKGDLNALWQAVGFERQAFWKALKKCAVIDSSQWHKETPQIANKAVFETQDFPQAYYDAIASALGVEHYNSKGFSKLLRCPFGENHANGDSTPSAAWHKDSHVLHCQVCGKHLAKETSAKVGVDWHNFVDTPRRNGKPVNLDAAPLANGNGHAPMQVAQAIAQPTPAKAGKQKPDYRRLIRSSKDTTPTPLLHSVAFPMPIFRKRFGGMFDMLPAGKICLVIGASGGGKSMLLETFAHNILHSGKNCIVSSSEWDEREWEFRQVIRELPDAGAITFGELVKNDKYLQAKKEGRWIDPDVGRPLTPAQQTMYDQTKKRIENSAGQIMYYDAKSDFANSRYLETFIECVADITADERRRGDDVECVIYDYAQLAELMEVTERQHERLMTTIKNAAIATRIPWILSSQANKSAVKANKKNEAFDSTDAKYINDEKANAVLMLNLVYNPDGTASIRDNRYGLSRVKVGKNSTGGSYGDMDMDIDFWRMAYVDAEAPKRDVMDDEDISQVPF